MGVVASALASSGPTLDRSGAHMTQFLAQSCPCAASLRGGAPAFEAVEGP